MAISTQHPDTDLLPEDFEEIDALLNAAEAAMLKASSRFRINGAKLERWRWDVPEVRTSWSPASGEDVHRNVIFLVQKVGTSEFQGVIDINAWRDEPFAGIATNRRWRNLSFDTIELSQEANLEKPILAAFAKVVEWESGTESILSVIT